MLRILVTDRSAVPDLLEHLRACGCIAFHDENGTVQALLPDAHWREEEQRIRAALDDWRERRPGVDVTVEPLR